MDNFLLDEIWNKFNFELGDKQIKGLPAYSKPIIS
jgi:hypothetical protein